MTITLPKWEGLKRPPFHFWGAQCNTSVEETVFLRCRKNNDTTEKYRFSVWRGKRAYISKLRFLRVFLVWEGLKACPSPQENRKQALFHQIKNTIVLFCVHRKWWAQIFLKIFFVKTLIFPSAVSYLWEEKKYFLKNPQFFAFPWSTYRREKYFLKNP